ncbi:MAG: 2-oxoglutarate dehydrogenase complex dihydrolipoyllysine-residue succinyltransferase [Bacteroidia bacterium]|nr:2-oxoglutarate dehydrogenase complex dihydrolipoyllysine-residue succinyltransferase [Bacteroidia bacterium]
MLIKIIVPGPGESVTEVVIARWLVSDEGFVTKDQEIAEIESDKATLPLLASESGKIHFVVKEGDTVAVGSVACTIDTSVAGIDVPKVEVKGEKTVIVAPATEMKVTVQNMAESKHGPENVKLTPLAKKLMDDNGLSVDDIIKGLRRISKEDVKLVLSQAGHEFQQDVKAEPAQEPDRVKMSQLRKKLSERLVAAKNQTAMLTTFNEVDMSNVLALRKKYQDQFVARYGIKLGLMSFFTRAATQALKQFPNVHTMLDGDEIVFHKTVNIGIAVQTPKGLMVPVINNAGAMSFAEIELNIARMADKARSNRISLDELAGGTFTITNGGVFGSLLSTPLLNPPQAAILGMHNITERPVAVNGKVEIRPMMFLALSYDHRLIDGRDSVGFLVKVKEFIENPVNLITGANPELLLLGLI